jgi:hypothetical protein
VDLTKEAEAEREIAQTLPSIFERGYVVRHLSDVRGFFLLTADVEKQQIAD